MAMKSNILAKLPFLAFILSLCAGAFVYGVVAAKWNWFPVPAMARAKTGLEAYLNLDDEQAPFGLVRYVDVDHPVIENHSDTQQHELILVAGGFFAHPNICPEFGCIAMVMDHQGQVYHSWSIDPNGLVSEKDFANHSGMTRAENLNVQGVAPTRDGGLIVTLQGRNMFPYYVGVVKLDKESNVEWEHIDFSHHWPLVAENGDVVLPVAQIVQPAPAAFEETVVPIECIGAVPALYHEGLRIRASDGTLLRETWFEDLLIANDLKGLMYAVRNGCDPYHVNGMAELNAAAAAGISGAEAGDLVLSLRSPSALIVLDRTEDVVHDVITGPMVAQHAPVVFADGRIGMFDNLGGVSEQGGSRILAYDPATRSFETLFPRQGDTSAHLESVAQGTLQLSEDGTRALVGETLGGRLLEVDLQTGDVLWEYENATALTLHKKFAHVRTEHVAGVMNFHGAHFLPREALKVYGAEVMGSIHN